MGKNKSKKQNIPSSIDKIQSEESIKAPAIDEVDTISGTKGQNSLKESLLKRENDVAEKEKELRKLHESISRRENELNEKNLRLEEQELQAKNGFPKLFEDTFAEVKKQLQQREKQCVSEWKSIETEKEKLRQRELAIQKAEIQRDKGYSDERAKLEEELLSIGIKQEKELQLKRESFLSAVDKEVSDERKSRLSKLEIEIAEKVKLHEASLKKEKDELEAKRDVYLNDKAKLDVLKEDLDYQKQLLQSRKESLDKREANIDTDAEEKVRERKVSFEIEKATLNEEIGRLRESVRTSIELILNFESLKQKLNGEDPALVLKRLKLYEEEIKVLREDLATRPTQEMQEDFDRSKSEKDAFKQACERLSERNSQLEANHRDQDTLEVQIEGLEKKNKILLDQKQNLEAHNNQLNEELRRYKAAYEREQDKEERISFIEKPYIEKELRRAKEEVNEIQWLSGISKSCSSHGIVFPQRILKAFHTALKTSEWSPITVLAGVSGTGKSILPKLYSHFGGINFLNLSVQPNWDSQESMLGFFNSIDNKFDAQPVLQFLAQTQKRKTEEYPFGLYDSINLILMDEMNLAHIELYFAEFLSKLEDRRDFKGDDVPMLEVKIGAGLHYKLPMGRNVLWVGTMNQDETTKSLSDKVLDRGIIINFPRPKVLERRKELMSLGERAPLLSRSTWQSWWCKKSELSNEVILPYKEFVEEMNDHLSKVGRALGHRVWQSIEYYICNYPDVMEAQKNKDESQLKKAIKIAFEDQLVQKVMPKLRGIETRGKSKSDCLDKIRSQLVNEEYTIIEDFNLACEFGYGQFMWNSANYITADAESKEQEPEIQ